MGARLVQIYRSVEKVGGIQARMRLAMVTCIPSANAETTADSAENLGKFKDAVSKILPPEQAEQVFREAF